MSGTIYQVMYDNAAGDHYVNEWSLEQWDNWEAAGVRNQEGHHNEYAVCYSHDELQSTLATLRGPTVYAVFENRPAGEAFVSEEDNLSGNWRGSKYGHFNCVAEYGTREEAESYAEARRSYYDSLERERQR